MSSSRSPLSRSSLPVRGVAHGSANGACVDAIGALLAIDAAAAAPGASGPTCIQRAMVSSAVIGNSAMTAIGVPHESRSSDLASGGDVRGLSRLRRSRVDRGTDEALTVGLVLLLL